MTLGYRTGDEGPAEARLVLAGAAAQPFTVRSAVGDGSAATLSVATLLELGEGWSFNATLSGAFGAKESAVHGQAALSFRF